MDDVVSINIIKIIFIFRAVPACVQIRYDGLFIKVDVDLFVTRPFQL